jgi:hypothetical protein
LGDRSGYNVVERGLHHKVWQKVTWFTNSFGVAKARTSSYTELATGMAYPDPVNGRLMPSSDQIQA